MYQNKGVLACLSIILFIAVCSAASANYVTNPSFESGTASWTAYGSGYQVVTTQKQDGSKSMQCISTSKTATYGAYQVLNINQATAQPITLSAFAMGTASGTGTFGLYADILLSNNEWVYGLTASLKASSSWQQVSVTTNSATPIKQIWLYCLYRNMEGTVYFDSVSAVAASGGTTTTTAAPTTTTKAPTTGTTTKAPTTGTTTTAPTTPPTTTPTTDTTGTPTTTKSPANTPYSVGMGYAIFASGNADIGLPVAKSTFESVGASYTIIIPTEYSGNLPLTASDGSGLFMGFVFTNDYITFSADQATQMLTYQITYQIKTVTLYSFPNSADGTGVNPIGASSNVATVTFATAASKYTSGYAANAAFPTDGVYLYPADITNSAIAVPAAYFQFSGSSTKYVAAVFSTPVDGTRSLSFYMDQAVWATHSKAIGMFWLQWMSNNFYIGLRRIFLNAQVDDLFMGSDVWNIEKEIQDESRSYRITPTELQNFANWQTATNARLPSGSNITISFPFNGLTVVENGGYTADPLFVKTKALIGSFTFMSHTYTHPYLNDLTYQTCYGELFKNLPAAVALFGSLNHPRYSNQSMVTPSISGIFNGNALRALWDNGIRGITGDNTRPELGTPNAYHGWYTNMTYNGFDGMYIMPREATFVYYDCPEDIHIVSQYNKYYRSYWGRDLTYDEITTLDTNRAVTLLLSFRYDSYMFHQVNIHQFTYKGKLVSTLSRWMDVVIDTINKYYLLPILSHTEDLLIRKWQEREARDACGFSGKINVSGTGQITGFTGKTTKSCTLAFTGATAATSSTISMESYGPDKTMYVKATANTPFTVTFTTPISTL